MPGPMRTECTNAGLLTSFLAVTFATSWGLLALARALGGAGAGGSSVVMVILPYGLGPLMGALFVQWRRQEPAASLLGGDPFPNRWFLVAWMLGPLVAIASMLVAPLWPGVELTTDLLRKLETMRAQMTPEQWEQVRKNFEGIPASLFVAGNFAPAVLYGATVGAAVAMGEEVGWRVTLLRGLAPLGFWRAAIVSGLVRGLWAAPLALAGFPYAAHPREGAGLVVAYSLLVGLLATYLRARGGSVLPSAILVGSLTSGAQVSDLLLLGGDDLTTRTTGLPGLAVLAVLVVAIVGPGSKAAREAWATLGAATK